MRHTFASKVACLFRELPDYTEDVETEWDLFKSAVITSAAACCGCKCVGGQMGSEKKTIRGKKTAFRAWLTNKSSEQHVRLRQLLSNSLKKSHGKNLDKSWIQTTDRQTKNLANRMSFGGK